MANTKSIYGSSVLLLLAGGAGSAYCTIAAADNASWLGGAALGVYALVMLVASGLLVQRVRSLRFAPKGTDMPIASERSLSMGLAVVSGIAAVAFLGAVAMLPSSAKAVASVSAIFFAAGALAFMGRERSLAYAGQEIAPLTRQASAPEKPLSPPVETPAPVARVIPREEPQSAPAPAPVPEPKAAPTPEPLAEVPVSLPPAAEPKPVPVARQEYVPPPVTPLPITPKPAQRGLETPAKPAPLAEAPKPAPVIETPAPIAPPPLAPVVVEVPLSAPEPVVPEPVAPAPVVEAVAPALVETPVAEVPAPEPVVPEPVAPAPIVEPVAPALIETPVAEVPAPAPEPIIPEPVPEPAPEPELVVVAPEPEPEPLVVAVAVAEIKAPEPAPAVAREVARVALPEDNFDFDEDIREIFIEEAAEVLETLGEYFPKWASNFDRDKDLLEVRRGFHTLKGSGRMVGAKALGEFAWSIENMLNKVRDKVVSPNQAMVSLINETMAMVPDLLTDFAERRAGRFDTGVLIVVAEALARGEPLSTKDVEQAVRDAREAAALA